IFDILPKENWWLTLLIFFVIGLTGILYFVEILGVKRGIIYSTIIVVIVYFVTSQLRLLPFINDDSLYAHTMYFAIAFLWISIMAIAQAFTFRMSLIMRTFISFLITVLIQYFLIPIIALFSHYHNGQNEYVVHYVIHLNGYLVITGYFIVFYLLLLFFETIWLVNYTERWQNRMIIPFVILMGIVMVIGLKDGLWITSVVTLIVVCSLIVVAKSKGRGTYH
ncbi:MAG: hypothetical protein KBT36_00725, partial [Kurthia sp.]|nr:hypothetical protein [Candidatus Kurthia equi]